MSFHRTRRRQKSSSSCSVKPHQYKQENLYCPPPFRLLLLLLLILPSSIHTFSTLTHHDNKRLFSITTTTFLRLTPTNTIIETPPKKTTKKQSRREISEQRFNQRLSELKDYLLLTNTTAVPKKYPPNPSLGFWVDNQRAAYKKLHRNQTSTLTPSRVARLDELGFIWTNVRDHDRSLENITWRRKFEELKRYKTRTGHVMVPQRDHGALGTWVHLMRRLYRREQQSRGSTTLTTARIERLNGLGFVWDASERLERDKSEEWMAMLEELKRFKEVEGHCAVPVRTGGKLGDWVQKQRGKYAKYHATTTTTSPGTNGTTATDDIKDLSPLKRNKISLLNAVGFVWDASGMTGAPPSKRAWEDYFDELKRFENDHGHARIPPNHPGLGRWVAAQRRDRAVFLDGRMSRMTEGRLRLLNDVGFEWDDDDDDDESLLSSFDGGGDGGENGRRRRPIKNYYNARDTAWNDMYNQLTFYKNTHGHCRVPISVKPLGPWVSRQRIHRKKQLRGERTSLTKDRLDRLDRLGFVWDASRPSRRDRKAAAAAAAWEDGFRALKEFRRKNGHVDVVSGEDDEALRKWMTRQRAQMTLMDKGKNTTLTREQRRRLEDIGFVWGKGKAVKKNEDGM